MGMLQAMGPTFLFPRTEVGPWRVVEPAGEGVHGAVYRVERVGLEGSGPFALKMAKSPQDPRFEREGHLLSIVRHPHVPLLHDRGEWAMPGSPCFPFLVMEWIEGVPLYAWAEAQLRSRAQQLLLLAQAARALEATHAVGGLHRDFKGGNILVRQQNAEAVLMDFGSGNYRGASILTRQLPPPGTPLYQSPESLRFEWKHLHRPMVRYEAQPADDVYALGTTAYRLLTGSYPPPLVEVETTAKGSRLVHRPLVLPERWAAASPELAALLHQMLSAEPAARGTAGEVAQALEREAAAARRQEYGPRRSLPALRVSAPSSPSGPSHVSVEAAPEREAETVAPSPSFEAPTRPGASPHPLRPRAGRVFWLAAAGVALSLGAWWIGQYPRMERPAVVAQGTRGGDKDSAGPSELADSAVAAPVNPGAPESARPGMGLQMPKKPLPGQRRPPCLKPMIEINGGCWAGPTDELPPCSALSYEWNKRCYAPIMGAWQPSTSDPP